MGRLFVILVFAATLLSSRSLAVGYDACSTDAIHTIANVTVSDGSTYSVESFYRSGKRAAAKFSSNGGSMHAVEGGLAWSRTAAGESLAGDFVRDFALGHNFHALLLRFEEMVDEIERVEGVTFAGKNVSALKGLRGTGGAVYLIDGETPGRPAGLRYDVGDMVIEIAASDWREEKDAWAPYELVINDGEREFTYRFSHVDLTDKPLLWFDGAVAVPSLDAVQIYRLHRRQLAAHCMADPALLASGMAPKAMMVNGGAVSTTTPEQAQARFVGLFERRRYDRYADLKDPVIEVAASGDIGWSAVNLSVGGYHPETGERFEEEWAWVSLVKKIDGVWRMAGNASNRRPN